jgi:fumarylacetoacetate (FAA) hydrolase
MAGVLDGNGVLNAGRLLGADDSFDMLALLDLGPNGMARLQAAVDRFRDVHRDASLLPEAVSAPRWLIELAAPLPRPRTFRDFYAYRSHVEQAYAKRGRSIPAAWTELPVFFYQHPGSLFGPDACVPYPLESSQLDFELEIAAVIGAPGRNIDERDAWAHVAGLTILSDWSARDLQQREMSVGLGPAKSKDFATSIGPVLVTLDELQPFMRDDRHHLAATVMINDDLVAETNAGENFWTLPQMIAYASRQTLLEPGDLIGLGTMARGCLLELGEAVHRWLEPGDEVTLAVEGIGRLRSLIGDPDGA